MSKLLEKLNNLELIHNQNNLLNEKINKLQLEKTYPDDKKRKILLQRKHKIQDDLIKYSVNNSNNSSTINTLKNENKILDLLSELAIGNTLEGIGINLFNLEETSTIELINSILKAEVSNIEIDNDNISNNNISNNEIDNDVNNIEIDNNLLLQLFKSHSFQELNKNLKLLKD